MRWAGLGSARADFFDLVTTAEARIAVGRSQSASSSALWRLHDLSASRWAWNRRRCLMLLVVARARQRLKRLRLSERRIRLMTAASPKPLTSWISSKVQY